MNADKNIVRSRIKFCIKEAVSVFSSKKNEDSLGDIYIKMDEGSGKIELFDDMENLLIEKVIEEWNDNLQENAEKKELEFIKIAKTALNELEKEGLFAADFIFKPFSVTLVDEHFIMIEELLFLDDENLKLDGEFLKGLDKELDDFLQDLMHDFE